MGHKLKLTLNYKTMRNWRNKEVQLVNETTGVRVSTGDTITSFRGQQSIVRDVEPPHKPSASGRVNGYYASVWGLKFVELDE
jgi:hypothetical protein